MPQREVHAPAPGDGQTSPPQPSSPPAAAHPAIVSKASIAGHPIHPMIIPFPLAFLVAVPVVDLVFWANNGQVFWARTGYYLLIAGIVTGVLAALVGLVDFYGVREVRRHKQSYWHAFSNSGALLLAVVNLVLRAFDPIAAVLPWGLLLSLAAAVLLAVGGWYGGELSYRFRIGVAAEPTEPG
jgi:uncharacterized membrane protein